MRPLALAFLAARSVRRPRTRRSCPRARPGWSCSTCPRASTRARWARRSRSWRRTGEQAGLVVFSDAAYELLPPGTPARELLPLLRFLKPKPAAAGQLPVNPWQDFRAGTRISAGLDVAREALERKGVHRGSIVLISDLEILPDEVERLGGEIADLKREGISVRIVPLNPTAGEARQDRGAHRRVGDPARAGAGRRVRAPEEKSIRAALPWGFALLALAVAVLLAVNERALARLEVRG